MAKLKTWLKVAGLGVLIGKLGYKLGRFVGSKKLAKKSRKKIEEKQNK